MTYRSVTECPACNGEGQVEDTRRKSTWYVKRVRACQSCGHTWSTAEIPLAMLQRTEKLEQFLRKLK